LHSYDPYLAPNTVFLVSAFAHGMTIFFFLYDAQIRFRALFKLSPDPRNDYFLLNVLDRSYHQGCDQERISLKPFRDAAFFARVDRQAPFASIFFTLQLPRIVATFPPMTRFSAPHVLPLFALEWSSAVFSFFANATIASFVSAFWPSYQGGEISSLSSRCCSSASFRGFIFSPLYCPCCASRFQRLACSSV